MLLPKGTYKMEGTRKRKHLNLHRVHLWKLFVLYVIDMQDTYEFYSFSYFDTIYPPPS